ncbi:MAG: NAD-dependent protein deacylase, partial [Firmicutes bacterium]|nr:NAD-dependent protein deacylase [Bacillota bacterium]
SVHRNTCLRCHKKYGLDYILDEANCENGVPKCSCGGVIKPDVVLYGEMLDDMQIRGAVNAISDADVLIIGGTSLVVYPAAGFVHYFTGDKLVILNKSETAADSRADLVIHDPIGEVLGECLNIAE